MPVSHVLLVFPEIKLELVKGIQEMLEGSPFSGEHQIAVFWAKDEAKARDEVKDHDFHLIITDLRIPPSRGSPLNPKEQRGLDLVQWHAREYPEVPGILVVSTMDEKLSDLVQESPNFELVLEGENFFNDLLRVCRQFLLKEEKYERLQANIDIGIYLDNIYQGWVEGNYTIKGVNWFFDRPPKKFSLDFKTLIRLARKSKELEAEVGWPQWEEELRCVGASLREALVDKNEEFKKNFQYVVKKVGGVENIRIRFTIALEPPDPDDVLFDAKKELHEVALEAMLGEQREFLMLQAPICRRLDLNICEEYRTPLFHKKVRDEPMNCLIIEADTKGFMPRLTWKGQPVWLKPLTKLREESEALKEYLKNRQLKVNQLVRIDKDTNLHGLSFKEYILKTLEKGKPWHLVHYAGHSLYADDGVGYVFFPGGNVADPLKIEEFSAVIRDAETRFVYLSSCYSSGADFVFQLANNQVPAILGFRWPIEDIPALEYAKKFYQELFEHRSLLKAFLEARRYMHDNDAYKENKIWAAPLLIMQICEDYD